MRRVCLWVAVTAAVACSDDRARGIDPFPLLVDTSTGPVIVGALADPDPTDSTVPAELVIDTLSPITVVDSFALGQQLPDPRRRRVVLTLFGLDAGGEPTIPRVRFSDVAAFEVHPCATGDVEFDCTVGLDGTSTPVAGIVGADVLGRSSVRFDFPDSAIRFFPDTAGNDAERARACDAVFSGPFHGGGTLIIAGTEANYAGRRPTVGACFAPPSGLVDEGVDALLVISTALGISVLSNSAYERYRRVVTDAPVPSQLPEAILHLTTGPKPVRIAEIDLVTLIGEESVNRGPCRELYANRVMSLGGCGPAEVTDCPCNDNLEFCRTAAATVLTEPVRFALVDDADPMLQSLRDELRPELPELDGILGTEPLQPLRVELDYPNSRILMRCLDPLSCQTRPKVRALSTLDELDNCDPPPPMDTPDAGVQ